MMTAPPLRHDYATFSTTSLMNGNVWSLRSGFGGPDLRLPQPPTHSHSVLERNYVCSYEPQQRREFHERYTQSIASRCLIQQLRLLCDRPSTFLGPFSLSLCWLSVPPTCLDLDLRPPEDSASPPVSPSPSVWLLILLSV